MDTAQQSMVSHANGLHQPELILTNHEYENGFWKQEHFLSVLSEKRLAILRKKSRGHPEELSLE